MTKSEHIMSLHLERFHGTVWSDGTSTCQPAHIKGFDSPQMLSQQGMVSMLEN